ncbi:MAG: Tyrosine-tRNA ligase, partial [Candidatus Woesebacteria bacterium GW2011_GWF1_40_24]
IKEVEKRLKDGENPLNLKKELGVALVTEFHSKEAAEKAEKNFKETFQEKRPTFDIKVASGDSLAVTIAPFTSLESISEAKRLIKQNAVDVDGKMVDNPSYIVKSGDEIKVGSRTFLKAK